ncbi:MAG: hydroxymethylbilane synthase [Gammaproteobacteria bacterium]
MQITIATRRSPLALRQAEQVAAALEAAEPGLSTALLPLSTRGDELQDRALAPLGGKGLFIKALEQALDDGRAQLAAHSLKDVPTELAPGFVLAAVMARADPRDVLVTREAGGLDALPRGARVGTASLRRQALLLHARPDLDVVTLRGSVETRLARLDAGELDAVVLAAAGLARLGIARGEALAPELMLPASGQGTIALEARAGDDETLELAAKLEDSAARTAATAERAFCRALGASCASPVAAYATVNGARIHLRVRVASADGKTMFAAEREAAAADAAKIGVELALELLAQGAGELLGTDNEKA